jgi:asparagine synthase (glutamine-hydrolysing)
MCGIAGALGRPSRELEAAVQRMNAAQAHRGPDGDGLWRSPRTPQGGQALFAHRRLAIIDTSADGQQPMTSLETGDAIVFNGEIYNYRELRAELEALGRHVHTRTDTEVLLAAWAEWGPACVERLRGMFAFALWDGSRGRVFFARDRLGIKPLYWARVDVGGAPTLLFASELRALLASELVERKLEPAALASYAWHGFVVGPQAIARGVRLMQPGTRASVDPAAPELHEERWWDEPGPPRVQESERELGPLREALEEAVRLRLVSDVPLGIFLSGGIDSSAVAALAMRAGGGTLRTFNVGFGAEAAELDESHHARAVAAALGTQHSELRLDEALFAARLPQALDALDQPTFDAINTWFVSRAVREAGITVALSGAGGDELFGGYSSFADLPRARRWSKRAAHVPAGLSRALARLLARAAGGAPGAVPPQGRWGKLADALDARGDPILLYQAAYALYTREFLGELFEPQALAAAPWGLVDGRHAQLAQRCAGRSELAAISSLELASFVEERLLRDTDSASMAASLEVRVPLLDHVVLERAAALHPDRRYQPLRRKAALREAALGALDPALFDRPKAGFVLPVEQWCRAGARAEVEAVLHERETCLAVGLRPAAVERLWRAFQERAPGIYWSRVWSIFILLWWSRRHRLAL